jgi:molecular chaperone GrpE (heat shock protein)
VESRTKALLTSCDIKRVEESGAFDPARQQAVASREAPRPELAHQIADTVRPGYVWHGDLLRPQQVAVYVPVND